MDPQHVGARLQTARQIRRISQEGLAARVGVRGMTISRAERGKSMLRLSTLGDIAAILGVSAAWLLTGEGAGPGEVAGPDEAAA